MDSTKEDERPDKLKIKYIIPDHIQDCFVTGAYGGINQKGLLQIHLYNERPAIPKSAEIILNDKGKLDEIRHKFGGDLIRIIQASLVMDVQVAKGIYRWLGKHIEDFESQFEEIEEETASENAKDEV